MAVARGAVARVASVQLGAVRHHGQLGARAVMDRPWSSGIVKEPMAGRARVTELGVAGDEQADLVNHGGPDKALLAYSRANLATWTDLVGQQMPPGGFGENLTVDGLDETVACIGDRFRIGSVEVQCTQPRQPCWKLARRWRCRELPQVVLDTGRSGWYLRVLVPGELGAGDLIELLDRPHPLWPVARATRVMQRVDDEPRAAGELAALPELSEAWRDALTARAR